MVENLLYILKTFCGLEREQWLPPEKLEILQWNRLQKILSHAYHHTVFYKKRFDDAGIIPENIKTPDDIKIIPITSREDLRYPDPLIAYPFNKERMFTSTTSGSSGRRTTTYFDKNAWIKAKYLIKLRARLACGLRPWDRLAMFSETEAKNTLFKQLILRQNSFSILDSIDDQIPMLERYDPSATYGFPSYYSLLADMNPRFHPSLIFTSSELLDDWTRKKIETKFQARVLDIYGCTEVKEISWECPQHKGYHVNADWLFIEFIQDEKGEAGGPGSLLVTSLYNYGMPLIRYEVGDSGSFLDAQCPCGRGLPLMTPTVGRRVDYFTLPDLSMVSPYKMTCAIEHIEGMKQYQIAQMKKERVVLKVVPTEGFDEERKDELKRALERVLPGVDVEVWTVDGIKRERNGKYKIVVSHVESKGGG